MPADRLVQQRGVEHRAGHRAGLVQARGERDQAVPRDRAVGGLVADQPGERRGLADRAAGVGADGPGREAAGDRRGRAARGAAGDPVGVPGVAGDAVGGVLRGGAHRELVHVGLAEQHRAGRLEPGGDGGVVGRPPALEDLRAAGGRDALGDDDVLERDGDAGQAGLLPGRVDLGRPRERGLGVDVEVGAEVVVGGLDAVEVGAGDVDRGRAVGQGRPELGDVHRRDRGVLTPPPAGCAARGTGRPRPREHRRGRRRAAGSGGRRRPA